MIPESKQVTEEYPWMQPEAIRWLEAILQPHWTVLETGMGGSTIFFARRVRWVVSFESSPQYYDRTMRLLQANHLTNVEGRFRQDYPKAGLGPCPEVHLAMVDGRGRVRSVIDAIPLVKPGGWIILDDSQRDRYEEARRSLADWKEQIIFRCGEDETRAWRKP